MSAKILSGKEMAAELELQQTARCVELNKNGIHPCLTVILVGEDPASAIYVRNKERACGRIGIESRTVRMPAETTQAELIAQIDALNADNSVHGILIQLPLPKHLDEAAALMRVRAEKDVDGFHPQSVGALSIGLPGFKSCTPAGIIELLKRSGIEIEGKECVIVGRSNIVGKPMAMLMIRENATVTVAHSKTKDLPAVCRRADILITAVGKARMFTADYVKPGAAVIDCGMNRDENGKLCGDVDYEDVFPAAGAITPVPGGVGPMTVAMLMKNCLASARIQGIVK